MTSLLTEALVARGVDVTLFATLDSVTSAKLDGVVPAPYSEDPTIDAKVWEYRHLSHLFAQADRFDLIHNQADFPAHELGLTPRPSAFQAALLIADLQLATKIPRSAPKTAANLLEIRLAVSGTAAA